MCQVCTVGSGQYVCQAGEKCAEQQEHDEHKTEKVERKLYILRSPNCPIHWEA